MAQEDKATQKEKSQDTVSVNARVPLDLVLDMDKQYSYLSRGKFTIKALEYVLNQKKCIGCNALNNPEASKCWKCGTPLYSDEQIKAAMRDIFNDVIKFDTIHAKNLLNAIEKMKEEGFEVKITPNITMSFKQYDKPTEDTSLDDIEGLYQVSVEFVTKNGIVVRPAYNDETPESTQEFWCWQIPTNVIHSYLSKNTGTYTKKLREYENYLIKVEKMKDEFWKETNTDKRNEFLDAVYNEKNKKE